MTTTLVSVKNPMPFFNDASGNPLQAGYLYFGKSNLNPETNPVAVYWDKAMTQPAAQPLRTSGGYVVRNGSPANIYISGDFSLTVKDKNGALVFYKPTVDSQIENAYTVVIGDGVTDNSSALQSANALGLPLLFQGVSVIGTQTTITVPIMNGPNSQIFTPGSSVTIDNKASVYPEWWGTGHATLIKAIAALPATGGTIKLQARDYEIVGEYHSAVGGPFVGNEKLNVKIYGSGMPRKSSDGTRFISGSGTVIQGSFINYASGFEAYDLGVDVGSYVTSTYNFLGFSPEGFVPGTHKFQGTPGDLSTYIQNVAFGNIKVLAVNNLNHACLIEFINGVNHGYIECDGGFHGYVVKATNVRGGNVWSYNQAGDSYIFKSDQYTNCSHVTIDSIQIGRRDSAVETAPGYWQSTSGGFITGYVQIGQLLAVNCKSPFQRVGDDEFITDIEVGLFSCDDVTGNGIDITGKFRRVQIGKHLVNNTTGYGVCVNDTSGFQESIDIGSGAVTNPGAGTNLNGYYFNSAALTHGDITVSGTTAAAVNRLNNTVIDLNRIRSVGATLATSAKEVINGTNLLNSWTNRGAGTWPFQVVQIGQTYHVRGTVQSGTTGVVAQLPAGYRPSFTLSFLTVAITAGGVRAFAHVDIDSSGNITVSNFAGAAPGLGGTGCVVAFNFSFFL